MVIFMIFAIFVIITASMVSKKIPALFALPLMAVLIAIVSGIPFANSTADDGTVIVGWQQLIFAEGPSRLAATMMTMIFASILGQLVKNVGIAETLIKKVSELAGDRPLILCLLMTLILASLFTTLSGLGSFILVGNIALPILISVGITPLMAATMFILSLNLGGIFNTVNWAVYRDVLGMSLPELRQYSLILGPVMAVSTLAFILTEFKRNKIAWQAPSEPATPNGEPTRVSILALLTPIVPLILIMAFTLDMNFSLIIGILYGLFSTINRDSMKTLTKSVIDGVTQVAAALFLMIGIGMLLKVVMDPRVTAHISGAISSVLPTGPIQYLLFFAILAPLALYRGPLNVWGLGLGLVALIAGTRKLPTPAIMAAFWTTGMIQGLDPTNTQNVWTASATGVDVNDILKKGIIFIWLGVIIALAIAGFKYF